MKHCVLVVVGAAVGHGMGISTINKCKVCKRQVCSINFLYFSTITVKRYFKVDVRTTYRAFF